LAELIEAFEDVAIFVAVVVADSVDGAENSRYFAQGLAHRNQFSHLSWVEGPHREWHVAGLL